jgi:hypothetical protein
MRTGETARACLFIFPYFMLLFIDTDRKFFSYRITLAGTQTILMQLIGNFYW